LYNQLQCYSVLEKYGMANDLFRQTPGLQRAENIYKDYEKLWPDLSSPPHLTASTKKIHRTHRNYTRRSRKTIRTHLC
jgi:hypothetical protein